MTQHTYIPIADFYGQWIPKVAGNHYVQVDDPVGSPDDDITYIYSLPYIPNGLPIEPFYHTNLGVEIPDTDLINFIQIQHRGKAIGGTRVGVSVALLDFTTYLVYKNASSSLYIFLAYTDFLGNPFYVDPRDSSVWTKAKVNEFLICIIKTQATNTARCTQIFLIVDHSPAPAVIKHLLDGQIKPLT